MKRCGGNAGSTLAVDDNPSQRLVQRGIGVTVASDPGPIAEGLPEGLAEDDSHVFDGVVRVHRRVASTADVEVEPTMPSDGVQHVVEEGDAGLAAHPTRAIDVKA